MAHDKPRDGRTGDRRTGDGRTRRWRPLELVFAVALVALLAVRFGPEIRARTGLPMDAPDLEAVTLAGDTVRLAELRGSVVLVNFWATWCAPCLAEMPAIQAVWEDHRDRGLVVIGLSVDDGPVSDFVARMRDDGVRYPLAFSPPGAQRAFGHSGTLPTTILIDRSGRVVHHEEGALSVEEIRALVEPLLE
ncbi:MAG: TlpA disulfide reductase family protein [Longimicrobiales bacterium]